MQGLICEVSELPLILEAAITATANLTQLAGFVFASINLATNSLDR